ncbi:MAG: sigma-70 family RNA polymerase sigma factor, partial [Lachnospiraceae bacterium]|nr:sigma-70 family RNA polymerase sigma factor [Lachnospiraceae bacterium]
GMTDEELVALVKQNNKDATDFIMNKYKNLVRTLAKTLFLAGADKEDLIQEGMIGLYKALWDFSAELNVPFRAFAQVCINRQMYTAITKSQARRNSPLNDYLSLDGFADNEDFESANISNGILYENNSNPEEMVIDKEMTNMIQCMLVGRLSKLEKKVFELYMKDYTYQKIAESLGKDIKAIDNAIQRIKQKLTTSIHCIILVISLSITISSGFEFFSYKIPFDI